MKLTCWGCGVEIKPGDPAVCDACANPKVPAAAQAATKAKKPTDKQRLYLEDLNAGRNPWSRACGMAGYGGMSATASSCIRAGWCDDAKTINDAGRAALASI